MVKMGEVVFFKKITKSNKPKSPEIGFKGRGFAVFLGHAPMYAPDPPRSVIFQMLGQIGLLSFDDVKEFLGEDAVNTITQKFTEKYYPKAPVLPIKKSGLVDENGQPIH
jgi:hypothetical protein